MAQDVCTIVEEKVETSTSFQTTHQTSNIILKIASKKSNELMISGGTTKTASNLTRLSVSQKQRKEPAL